MMQNRVFIYFLLFFLISCNADELYEKEIDNDNDDINVIEKYWEQQLDNAIKLMDTKTKAS